MNAAPSWIDATNFHLMSIFATDTHAEFDASWGGECEGRELSGDGHWMSQGQEVNADKNVKTFAHGGQGSRIDEAIHSEASMKANVICDEKVINVRSQCVLQKRLALCQRTCEERWRSDQPDLQLTHELSESVWFAALASLSFLDKWRSRKSLWPTCWRLNAAC